MLDSQRGGDDLGWSCFGVDWSTGKKLSALGRAVGGKVWLSECGFSHAYVLLSCMNVTVL